MSWALIIAVLGAVAATITVSRTAWHPAKRLVKPRFQARLPAQRVKWDVMAGKDPQKGGLPPAYEASKEVFLTLPSAIAEEKDFEDIADWLREDTFTVASEEIYIVARQVSRLRRLVRPRIIGVLYASLTRARDDKEPHRTSVWYLAIDPEAPEDRVEVAWRLWRSLRDEIERCTARRECDFFFEVPRRTRDPKFDEELKEYLPLYNAFLERLGRAKIMDMQYENAEGRAILVFFHDRVGDDVSKDDTLDFIYRTLFWAFVYAEQERTLKELVQRALLYEELRARVDETVTGPSGKIALHPLASARSRELGFLWWSPKTTSAA
jgi:hypothetical protein